MVSRAVPASYRAAKHQTLRYPGWRLIRPNPQQRRNYLPGHNFERMNSSATNRGVTSVRATVRELTCSVNTTATQAQVSKWHTGPSLFFWAIEPNRMVIRWVLLCEQPDKGKRCETRYRFERLPVSVGRRVISIFGSTSHYRSDQEGFRQGGKRYTVPLGRQCASPAHARQRVSPSLWTSRWNPTPSPHRSHKTRSAW